MNENSLPIPMLQTDAFEILHVLYRRMIRKYYNVSDQLRILEGGSNNV
jgi:hypothetical protein